VLAVNASMANRTAVRTDIASVALPANEMAETLGNRRLTNMIMLGALLARLPVLSLESIEQAMAAHLPERHRALLPVNYKALRQGAAAAG
jgi:2-oxoglutarate ferredoxin oxidoreductase subunit gamma